ncbi:MAG: hypothetical protein HOI95_28650 [Chromatiales bacterium]|mgnify:CR=1 FL=1|nr:hypothetical protein [Chromatiales bacterium]
MRPEYRPITIEMLLANRPWARGRRAGASGHALHHGGTNNSWFALVWIAPERDFAVLVASNIGGEGVFEKVDAVVAALIDDHLSHPSR